MNNPAAPGQRQLAVWLVLLAAAGTFALTMGVPQTMGLFLGSLNTSTGVGLANISLAFAFGQLWWGLTQPIAGALADKLGAGRVLFAGVTLVALGTFITPLISSTAGLIFAIGVLAAGGAGMAGPRAVRSGHCSGGGGRCLVRPARLASIAWVAGDKGRAALTAQE